MALKYNYRRLISEKEFLKVQKRAMMLNGSLLQSISYKPGTLVFKTRSGTFDNKVWVQTIQIPDVDKVNSLAETNNLPDVLRESGLKVHCNCIAKDTRIKTENGYKKIQDITQEDYVLGTGNWVKVAGLLKSQGDKQFRKIGIKGELDPLVLSDDHKVWTLTYRVKCACGCGKPLRDVKVNSNATRLQSRKFIPKHAKREVNDNFQSIQLKTVKDLLPGDKLLSPIIESGAPSVGRDYARMLGYYLAEGHIPKRGRTVVITLNRNEERTIAADIKKTFETRGIRVDIKQTGYGNREWLVVNVFSVEFRDACRAYCGEKSENKKLSAEVLNFSRDEKIAFLVGHLLGDGAVDKNFRFMTTSRDMAEDLKLLINSLGIDALCSYASKSPKGNRKQLYQVGVALNDLMPYVTPYKQLFREPDRLKENNSRGKSCVIENYVIRTIYSIEETHFVESYDVSLFDEPHLYTANGVLVSNCPAFHYWGYKYMAYKRGYGIQKEFRRPRVRNPYQQGYLCKHLFSALIIYPFIAGTVASRLKLYEKRVQRAEKKQD